MTPEYEAFKEQVAKQRRIVDQKQTLANKQRAVLTELLKQCTHEELEEKSSYSEGDYYNKASTDRWMQCKLCGERGPVSTTMHSYYG